MRDNNGPRVEKLRGRENFDIWKVGAKSYLTIKGLWSVIEKETPATESPETNAKTIGELTLMIEASLYSYLEESPDAYIVWKGLVKAFEDSGVARKKSKAAGFRIDEDVVASLLLGGLPDEFRPMILGIENSGQELTIDYVKQILLQGIPDPLDTNEKKDAAMYTFSEIENRRKGYKGKRSCFKCGDILHLRIDCPKADLKCSKCGDFNHLVENCITRKVVTMKNASNNGEEPLEF
ncbi:uncharacterized protein LOC129579571 [Sitodiplosis mosellana]|uniref:uncharacterized protein LOC129579571 n=1 Tax=Sitodiplosis mosellana TaxID=263140 RepID=UPI00244522A1|nr:uncharacterized protein LOC129579571 [Sitodiplosis mosellana]